MKLDNRHGLLHLPTKSLLTVIHFDFSRVMLRRKQNARQSQSWRASLSHKMSHATRKIMASGACELPQECFFTREFLSPLADKQSFMPTTATLVMMCSHVC